MTPHDFYQTYAPFAKESEAISGVPYLSNLGQSALETGWGIAIKGNNLHGIKAPSGTAEAYKQLLTTTEYFKDDQQGHRFPVVHSITDVSSDVKPIFKYVVDDWFMKFDTPADSFKEHDKVFLRTWGNDAFVYPEAVKLLQNLPVDPYAFIDAIAPHYSTSPDYAKTVKSIMTTLKQFE